MLICAQCCEAKPWRRFRVSNGKGVMREVNICSTCRNKNASTKCRKAKQLERQLVLNRTHHQTKIDNNYPFYYPDLERKMRSYCKKKTAMDRKYLNDHQHEPLSTRPHLAAKQLQAREHAKGWIALYDEICEHAINLLRQTDNRPPWVQLEGKADLHRLHGVYDTKRAQLLRLKG